MLAISLTFPTKRFHATPWGRQVNEGAVEWPPSPWRLLRSLIAVWHHKFPNVPEAEVRELVERLAAPPRFALPPASQGHTRHYMPLADGEKKTKIFDTFVAVEPQDTVIAAWPDVELTPSQRDLLGRLLKAMTYFGRAESWVCADLLNEAPADADVIPCEIGQEPPPDRELVRTLVPVAAEEHLAWYDQTRQQHRGQKLSEQIAKAMSQGKPTDKLKLSPKDEKAIDASLPATLFDALHADTSALRKAGWNQPPGSRWINYARSAKAFLPTTRVRRTANDRLARPTVARFAICSAVRPLLTETILVGERARTILMGCSKKVRDDANAAAVFSGKDEDGAPLIAGHQHAHFLCEAASGDGRISHLTIFAPMGFDSEDERAFERLARCGVWGKGGHDLQLILLGIGCPEDFGGITAADEKSGKSRLLGTSCVWTSRTPLVLTRHLARKGTPGSDIIARDPRLQAALIEAVRFELANRPQFSELASRAEIEPLLERQQTGAYLGGHFTSWLKFRRERLSGRGAHAGSHGFGLTLRFPQPVTGPIALGYGAHFGLGLFVPE